MSSADIPSTDVVRHWVAWGTDEDFSKERVEQFEAWLTGEVEKERDRIIGVIIDSELGDYDAGFLIARIKGEAE